MRGQARSEELRFDFEAPSPPAPAAEPPAAALPRRPGSAPGSSEPGGSEASGSGSGRADASAIGAPVAGDGGSRSDTALAISEFYDHVRRALARELPGEVWVVGEIRNHRESKGHHYLELADEGSASSGRPPQQLEVVCWAREWRRVGTELHRAGAALEIGRVVRVRGRVALWEGAGKLRLAMTALDIEALVGGIAIARQRLLAALDAEGLLEANRRRALGLVPLRIGVVTSEGSEAHHDLVGCLERSGYAFEIHVERSLVQGPQAPHQLAGALRRLERFGPDLAVVVRGGGGRGDLAAFDSEPVARAIAAAPFPIWTGIGHTGDRSVADELAQASFTTPTACGEALVARVDAYWRRVQRAGATLSRQADGHLAAASHRLEVARAALASSSRHQLDRRGDELNAAARQLREGAARLLEQESRAVSSQAATLGRCRRSAAVELEHRLRRCRDVLRAYDPQRQLERGWSMTRDRSGRLVRSLSAVAVGSGLVTVLVDGEIESVVEAVRGVEGATCDGEEDR